MTVDSRTTLRELENLATNTPEITIPEVSLELLSSEELYQLQSELSKITATLYAKTIKVLIDFSNKVYAIQKSRMVLNTTTLQPSVGPAATSSLKTNPRSVKTDKIDKQAILAYLAKLNV